MATKRTRKAAGGSKDAASKYTDPALREKLKNDLMASDKGGRRGHWSARKSQLLAAEYERHGGGYTTNEKDGAARALDEWTDEDWSTASGDARARHGRTTERYLPKAVWNALSDEDRAEAERTKEAASRRGEGHVEWPPAVKRAMERFTAEKKDKKGGRRADGPTKADLLAEARKLGVAGRSKMTKARLAEAVRAAR